MIARAWNAIRAFLYPAWEVLAVTFWLVLAMANAIFFLRAVNAGEPWLVILHIVGTAACLHLFIRTIEE